MVVYKQCKLWNRLRLWLELKKNSRNNLVSTQVQLFPPYKRDYICTLIVQNSGTKARNFSTSPVPWVTFPIVHLLPTNSRGRDATQYPLLQTLFCHESAHHVDFFSFFFSVAMTQYTLGGYGELLWLRPNFSGRQDRREVPWPRRILKTKIPMEFHNFVFFFSFCHQLAVCTYRFRFQSENGRGNWQRWLRSRDCRVTCVTRQSHVPRCSCITRLVLFVAIWNSLLPSGTLCCRLAQGNAKCHW